MSDTLALVHEFTRPHKTKIVRDDGTNEYVSIESLLDQLDAANTANRGTGGSGSKTKAPCSLDAVDIRNDINTVAHKHHPQSAGRPVRERIQAWAAWAVNQNDDTHDASLNAWLTYWRGKILDLFDSTVEIEAPCPSCGERLARRDDGHETIIKRALSYNSRHATCTVCGTAWEGIDGMRSLVLAIEEIESAQNDDYKTSV